MVSLFLAYSLASKACAAAPTDDSIHPSCMDINDSRTLLNIIWSCITTIFLCTWVAIHPNIPEPIDTSKMGFFKRASISMHSLLSNRLPVLICALIVSEYILSWAIRQFLAARELAGKNGESLECGSDNASNLLQGFTTTQGFFIVMGGFHYFPESPIPAESAHAIGDNTSTGTLLQHSEGTDTSTDIGTLRAHPLDKKEVTSMVNDGKIILPTEAEIKDKSKSDWIAKSLVLLQTTWFIVQCIARRIEHLPTTELEIVTLAYTVLNFGIFIAWWDKPKLVSCPIRVSEPPTRTESKREADWFIVIIDSIIGARDGDIDLHSERMVPRFYGGDMDNEHTGTADTITLLVGVVFGAIHCIAWSFEFPSHTETFLWQMSSAAIICVSVLARLTLLVAALVGSTVPESSVNPILMFVPLSGVLYVAARLTTLILAFMNLSSAPPGVLQAVHWTTLIPHL